MAPRIDGRLGQTEQNNEDAHTSKAATPSKPRLASAETEEQRTGGSKSSFRLSRAGRALRRVSAALRGAPAPISLPVWRRRTLREGATSEANHIACRQGPASTPESNAKVAPLSIDQLDGCTTSQRVQQWLWALVALGITVRVVRYLLRFPLWGDEAFIAANFLERGYADLLRPLEYHQVSPILFLWVELSVVRLLGFTEWTLRLFPTVCSILSVVLMAHVASRLLSGAARLFPVAVFSVAYYPIRHGGEVKAYAIDLFVALVLLALAIEWWRAPRRIGWLVTLAAVVPLAIGLSLPAVFVAGGISLALLAPLWQQRRRSAWCIWFAYNVLLVASFGVVFFGVVAAQYEREFASSMKACWDLAFPPWRQPLRLMAWLAEAHTGRMFAYPAGGKNGGSTLTLVWFVVAIVFLWRHRRRVIVAMALLPMALALVAAAAQRYPYGFSARTMQYLAPTICLLAGLGAAVMIGWIRSLETRRRVLHAALVVLFAIGIGFIVRDLLQPYKTIYDWKDRAFAVWLWTDKAHDAELVCAKTDLGLDFFPGCFEWGHSAIYLCNQRIYSPRHRRGPRPIDWSAIRDDHPLRCVVYSIPGMPCDKAALDRWLADMQRRYRLVDHQRHLLNADSTWYHEQIELYDFVPKPGVARGQKPAGLAGTHAAARAAAQSAQTR